MGARWQSHETVIDILKYNGDATEPTHGHWPDPRELRLGGTAGVGRFYRVPLGVARCINLRTDLAVGQAERKMSILR